MGALPKTIRLSRRDLVKLGFGVAGAAVLAIGVENTTAYATPFTTDGAGTATIDVPPGNEHVDVQILAPGFALRQFRMKRPDIPAVRAHMAQVGGRLRLLFDGSSFPADVFPVVVHDRAVFSAYALNSAGFTGMGEVVSSLVETGPWALCSVSVAQWQSLRNGSPPPPGVCVMGLLAPGAELVLDRRKTP